MASASAKLQTNCKECLNGVTTCNGCLKKYCVNHYLKHRQELAERMDGVGQEFDQLQQDLAREDIVSDVVSRIENWKKQSIKKIEDTAKQAQEDLQRWFARTKKHLQESSRRITEQLKSSQASNNYAENDLDEWMKQLMQLREMMSKPLIVDVVEDDTTQSWIRMIKVIDRPITEQLPVVSKTTIVSNSPPAISQSIAGSKQNNAYFKIPKAMFDMNAFKRVYSNEDTITKAIPYFWNHFDNDNYSIWFCEYKYPEELTQIFMTCNLVSGMFQRLDELRKTTFASMCIFGENNNNTISGVWIWPGHTLIFELSPDWQIDYQSYSWIKLSIDNPATKPLVNQYLSWEGEFKGKKFNQGKIFK